MLHKQQKVQCRVLQPAGLGGWEFMGWFRGAAAWGTTCLLGTWHTACADDQGRSIMLFAHLAL